MTPLEQMRWALSSQKREGECYSLFGTCVCDKQMWRLSADLSSLKFCICSFSMCLNGILFGRRAWCGSKPPPGGVYCILQPAGGAASDWPCSCAASFCSLLSPRPAGPSWTPRCRAHSQTCRICIVSHLMTFHLMEHS